MFQERKGRQLPVETQERYEGDILVGSSDLTNPDTLSAHLANPDMMWPSGVVEYKFYHTFPQQNRAMVLEAMTYISTKVAEDCIIFQEATGRTQDYVLIRDGVNVCNSEVGRMGGEQVINLSR